MKHPNGYFNKKPCRVCGEEFQPEAPSNLYCSLTCKERGYDHAYLMRTYNIPLSTYEEMFKEQRGKCAICDGKGFKMRGHHRKMLVVDHCHGTGAVRGLLCHNCNRALGLLKDCRETIRQAFKYLGTHKEGATTIPKGSTPEAIAGGSAEPLENKGEDIVWTRRKRRAA
jgi:hypothetical protein